jgi:hypothetical protein
MSYHPSPERCQDYMRIGAGGLSSGSILGNGVITFSCEALTVGAIEQWVALPPLHDSRLHSACAAVARCVIVAEGYAEVYDGVLDRWLRLSCDPPYNGGLSLTGSALL